MRKHYVLDTNALLEDPNCITVLRNGEDNLIGIPFHVILELDRLKKEPRLKHLVSLAVDAIQRNLDGIQILRDASHTRFNADKFEILPLAFIRGMNIEDAIVIIDETQNLSRYEIRALLTRMGENVRCFCLGDTRQVDNPYLSESNNALNWIVRMMKGARNYAHIVIKGAKSRGPICDMVLKSGL